MRTRKAARRSRGKETATSRSDDKSVTMEVHQSVKYASPPLLVVTLIVSLLLCFVALSIVLFLLATPEKMSDGDEELELDMQGRVLRKESLEVQHFGGWRVADGRTRDELDIDHCDVERREASSLTSQEFESVYRFKKPVLITFANGAAGWTNPDLFRRQELTKLYAYWSVSSGRSLDIVKSGGSGKIQASFSEFIEELMDKRGANSSEPLYVFDRDFYQDSELPHSLHPPHFFKIEEGIDESFFFMGATKSGVSFHKHADAWNAVVFGRKRWFLYPPGKTPPGGVWPGYSQLDWFKLVYPTLQDDDKPIECVQEAGEILYLPESYYHGTINIGDTLAIGLQKNVARTPVERLFYILRPMELRVGQTDNENEKSVLYEQIVEKYYRLYELLPSSAEICHKLGEALFNDRQYKEALEFTQKAIDLDPKFVVAHSSLSRYLKEQGDLDGSEVAIKTAYGLNPQNFDVITQCAEVAETKKDLHTALYFYQQGIRLEPDFPLLYFRMSFILMSLGRHEEALQMNKKAQLLEEEHFAMQTQNEEL